MPTETVLDIAGALEELKAQMADMAQRIEALEYAKAGKTVTAAPVVAAATPAAEPPTAEPAQAAITEEEVLAISAAIGAFLGVRAHIRQIRLLSSNAWAQQGRVSIQASHRLG